MDDDDALSGAERVSNKEIESEDSQTFNLLQQQFWVWQCTSSPPPLRTLHSHLTSILTLHGHLMSTQYLHDHLMATLSLNGHLKSTLPLQTGKLSLPRVTLTKLHSWYSI